MPLRKPDNDLRRCRRTDRVCDVHGRCTCTDPLLVPDPDCPLHHHGSEHDMAAWLAMQEFGVGND